MRSNKYDSRFYQEEIEENLSILSLEKKQEQKLAKKKLRNKDHDEPSDGMDYLLDTLPCGEKIFHYRSVSNEGLSQLKDYKEAYDVQGFIFTGREKDIKNYKKYFKYPQNRFHIFHPEARGIEFNLARNMAFMLGVMQSGKTIRVVSSIHAIYQRGKEGLEGLVYDDGKVADTLGYALAEVLWLLDNGYTFKNAEKKHQAIATPPNGLPVANPVIRVYGHVFDPDAKDQVERLKQLSDQLYSEIKKSQPKKFNDWANTTERPWNTPASTLTNNDKKEEINKKLENKTQFLSYPKPNFPDSRPWRRNEDNHPEKFSTNFFSEKNQNNHPIEKKVVVNPQKNVTVVTQNKISNN